MSDLDRVPVERETDPVVSGAVPSGPTARRALVIAALMVLAGAGSWYWLTHAAPLLAYGNGLEVSSPIGRTTAFDTNALVRSAEGVRLVTLTSVAPRIVRNTSGATVVLKVCRYVPGNGGVGSVDAKDLGQFCTRVDPLSLPLEVDLSAHSSQILTPVTPQKAGVVDIVGYDVAVRSGVRSGKQHVGLEATIRGK